LISDSLSLDPELLMISGCLLRVLVLMRALELELYQLSCVLSLEER
jgi:hypothetical protein